MGPGEVEMRGGGNEEGTEQAQRAWNYFWFWTQLRNEMNAIFTWFFFIIPKIFTHLQFSLVWIVQCLLDMVRSSKFIEIIRWRMTIHKTLFAVFFHEWKKWKKYVCTSVIDWTKARFSIIRFGIFRKNWTEYLQDKVKDKKSSEKFFREIICF